jgi:hypothetical protein
MNNSYAPPLQFQSIRTSPLLHRDKPAGTYSQQVSSRSVVDGEHLSSFGSKPEIVESLYKVEGSARVHRFVREHPELFSILLRTRTEIYSLFGLKTPLIRMEEDFEDEFEPRLVAMIQTTLDANRAMALLDELDDHWWLSTSFTVRNLMKIDVEYI